MMIYGWQQYKSHFSNNPDRDAWMYLLIILFFTTYAVLAIFCELFTFDCVMPESRKFPNAYYNSDPCLDARTIWLGFMSRREADFFRRILCAVLLGSVIG